MNFKAILFEQKDNIARITLNIPEKMNPLDLDMRVDLLEAFRQISDDDSVKVVIMTGSGKAFSAGGDIRTMEGLTSVATRVRLKRGQRPIKAMIELEKPIIGAINGVAAGAGVSLALACDILIASEEAKFAMSFVKIGLIPDMGSYYLVPLRVGVARAKELMFTGDMIDAREAERIGLVNKVVSPEKLEEEVSSLASRLANGPSQAYAMIKAALNRWPASLESFFEMESSMQAVAFSSEDFDEGRRAFLEKRKSVFCGK
jgi:2-(1,2-epoxy-1,2-dihydrophenyl)acetyl-CoA isomerase